MKRGKGPTPPPNASPLTNGDQFAMPGPCRIQRPPPVAPADLYAILLKAGKRHAPVSWLRNARTAELLSLLPEVAVHVDDQVGGVGDEHADAAARPRRHDGRVGHDLAELII